MNDVAEIPRTNKIDDLLWLSDAPLFIDSVQIRSFYDAVIRPDSTEKSIEIEVTEALEKRIGGELKGGVTTSFGKILESLFPSITAETNVGLSGESSDKNAKSKKIRLEPIDTPQRQLVQLSVHYLTNITNRIFLVEDPSAKEWRTQETILKSPRELVFLDLSSTIVIPTAAEFENNAVVPLFPKLEAVSGERPPEYPESKDLTVDDLAGRRKDYWNWFRTNFKASQAIKIVESAATENGKIRWIDYRVPITEDGDTLHLHMCPRGEYDTGVFAYNLIKRGEKHGLRLVGTLKSEPDMNVLAVYER